MASDTDANDISDTDTRFHEDHEWEAQRDNFLQFYKDQKMTLKAATQSMIDCYGFYATPRQWERKISSWGVKKYTSRSERMHTIETSEGSHGAPWAIPRVDQALARDRVQPAREVPA
jgi:hypothetical protein